MSSDPSDPNQPFSFDLGDLILTPPPPADDPVTPPPAPEPEAGPEPRPRSQSQSQLEHQLESEPEPPIEASALAPSPAGHPLERVDVPAVFPFSLMIEGELSPTERDKILDILSREKMGVREVDLEPQFLSHRVLIPRISEYAGVLIVQALRSTGARMRLGPSDEIFATPETREPAPSPSDALAPVSQQQSNSDDQRHPAEGMAITTLAVIPEMPDFVIIDTVTASATLKAKTVEIESSSEYQEILEALSRELKYKAHRRGAVAILSFEVQLFPLHLSTSYRLLVSGTAVKPAGRKVVQPPEFEVPDFPLK